jgi:hypothetical protein
MTGRQRLALAVFVSLLLHLTLIAGRGWRVPTLNDMLLPESAPQLEAHLVTQRRIAPPQPRSAAQPPARPSAQRKHSNAIAVPPGMLAMPADVEPRLAMSDVPSFAPRASSSSAKGVSSNEPASALSPAEAAPPAAVPVEMSLPRRGSIRFAVSRGEKGFVIGQAVHRWSHDGNNYTMSGVTETTGIAALFRPVRLTWTSAGELGPEGLRPREFHSEKDGVAVDSASFDWPAMTLALSAGAQREVPLVSGAQDMLSLFYQLGLLLPTLAVEGSAGKSYARSEIMVATGRKFERYGFDALGEETLQLKFGKQRALHFRTASGVEATEVWLALDLHCLPVKIHIIDRKGESYDQIADDIEFEGMPSTLKRH